MDNITFSVKKGRFEVAAQITRMGGDLLVVLSGGIGHIGAIGIAQPRESLSTPGKTSSTGSVFTYTGHKEDVVVKPMAEEIAKRLNRKVVVVAGIHWDRLSANEIEMIVGLCNTLKEKIVKEAKAW